MSFVERLRTFIKEREEALPHVESEDQAKLALVFPFLRHLGYDTTNPAEVVPEFTADVGTKKGEKVDVALKVKGTPAILIECKAPGESLTAHNGQLYRYFSVTNAKFAILTNGREYLFYSDVDEPNKMDSEPFMRVDLFSDSDLVLAELQRFEKSQFDPEQVADSAEHLKYTNNVKAVLARELDAPSDDFVRHLVRDVFRGRLTQSRMEEFRSITQKAIREYMKEYVNSHIKQAMDRISQDNEERRKAEQDAGTSTQSTKSQEEAEPGVTEEEQEVFRVLKAIAARRMDPSRLALRDGKTYNSVLVDGNLRKGIARLKFGPRKKTVELLTDPVQRVTIDTPDSLYRHIDAVEQAIQTQID